MVIVAVNMDGAETPAATAILAAMLPLGTAMPSAPPFSHHSCPLQHCLHQAWRLPHSSLLRGPLRLFHRLRRWFLPMGNVEQAPIKYLAWNQILVIVAHSTATGKSLMHRVTVKKANLKF